MDGLNEACDGDGDGDGARAKSRDCPFSSTLPPLRWHLTQLLPPATCKVGGRR